MYDIFSFLKRWVTTVVTQIEHGIPKTHMLLRIATRCCGGRDVHDAHDGLDDVLLRAAKVVRLEGSHSRTAGARCLRHY
jgi:hypothetical protein